MDISTPDRIIQNFRKLVCLMVLLGFVLSGCTATHENMVQDPPPDLLARKESIQRAKETLAAGNNLEIVGFFRSSPVDPVPGDFTARELFLLGRAYFNVAEEEIGSFREGSSPGMGSLPEKSVSLLSLAHDTLLAAADDDPGSQDAPLAYYLAGKTMDYGFLQDFDKAMEIYQWAAAGYPESEFGKRAAKRHLELSDILMRTKPSSHGN